MIDYEANNQWIIYNPITKKIQISHDMIFDKGYMYDFKLNKRPEEVREFWSPENGEQLAI